MQLADLLDVRLLDSHLCEGLVSVRLHPTAPLRIFNYTAKCQYNRAWDDVTRQCRGLIVNDGNVVVARPWPKFYNYGEHVPTSWSGEARPAERAEGGGDALPHLDLDALVEVTDKLDGSLGILYPSAPGRWEIATRGSFESEQALRATKIWRDHYGFIMIDPSWTWLFEIVYPENRIVVDYAGMDDLVFLGAAIADYEK
ncbi:MAG: RNA ligase [Candidatus Limnocylindrales bacterium]|nr:RNA ligase [Candidatus Limnocylindrales bacterium]